MDTYREHPSDFGLSSGSESSPSEADVEIGSDERRMHAAPTITGLASQRARLSSIEDLEPARSATCQPQVLPTHGGRDNPPRPMSVRNPRGIGLAEGIQSIDEVPAVTAVPVNDHYMQIIANRAPIGFEAEFGNHGANRSATANPHAVLVDGDTIDFIYGS